MKWDNIFDSCFLSSVSTVNNGWSFRLYLCCEWLTNYMTDETTGWNVPSAADANQEEWTERRVWQTILLKTKYWLICVTILLTERMLLPSFLPTPAWIVGSTQRLARDFILAGANSFKELNNQHKYGLSTTTKCLSTLFRYPQPRQCG